MKRFKKILLVVEPDAKQQTAVDRAVALVRQNEAELTVMTVVKGLPADCRMAITVMSPQELLARVIDDSREKTDALVAKMGKQGIYAKTQVMNGTPFLEVIRQVLRDKHDLVILAAEGKGGLKDRVFGSTSMHLMRKCPCPVWVVKTAKRARYKQILAAVDATSDSPSDREQESLNRLILKLASSLAKMDNSELRVVQVWSVFGEDYLNVRGGSGEQSIRNLRKKKKREYAEKLDSLLAGVDLDGIAVHKHLPRADNVAKAILKLSKSKNVDLLVMGTVCRTGIPGFFIGNTAEKVLGQVDCSVLTVKPEAFVTPVTLETSRVLPAGSNGS